MTNTTMDAIIKLNFILMGRIRHGENQERHDLEDTSALTELETTRLLDCYA